MRVVVNIPPGSHPELLQELERTSPRERAERLRMLATFGLVQMNQSTTKAPHLSIETAKENQKVAQNGLPLKTEDESRKQLLKSKLVLGV